jgi:hypothetical protein
VRAALLLLILPVAGCRTQPPTPPSGFRTAIWQWHAPFAGVPADLPVDDVYVRAATLSFDGERLVPTLPQRFERGERRPVSLVLNFDAGAARHFGELPEDQVATVAAEAFLAARRAAERQGTQVRGLQLDLDCPARLLPKYARVCRVIRSKVPKATLSVTGLVSWIGDDRLRDLVAAVDEFVPQFYEGRLPQRFEADVPVSDHRDYASVMETLARLGKPYRIGVAAYGQVLLYDARGRLAGVSRGLSLADAFRHPSLRFDSLREVQGERHVRFTAVKADAAGRGLGYGILFRIPTALSFAAALAAARDRRPANCVGIAVYRLAEAGETATLPAVTVAEVLRGRKPVADVRRETSARSNPYALIEGTARERAGEVRVAIRNAGLAPRLESEPVRVDVRFAGGCADTVATAYADRVVSLGPDGRPMRVSLERATGVRFGRRFIDAQSRVELGVVRLKPGCTGKVSETQ